ncbi:MAG: SDR family oxidoreductase [Bacteroidales bacterium]|nr:SDR family oxidoreductase [Bacteroidales bacterium]
MNNTEKLCLITGASKGIGRATAIKLAHEGYSLALMARDIEALENLAEELSSVNTDIITLKTDLLKKEDIIRGLDTIFNRFGNIDILINNAGLGHFRNAEDLSLEEWDETMSVNVRSGFILSKEVIAGMKKSGGGHIVAVASDVSKRTFARGSAYCASKYAQDAFFAALRKEVRDYGIKVSTIYPGLVDTPFHAANPDADGTEWLKAEDVANAIHYIIGAPKHVVIDELMIHPISQDY